MYSNMKIKTLENRLKIWWGIPPCALGQILYNLALVTGHGFQSLLINCLGIGRSVHFYVFTNIVFCLGQLMLSFRVLPLHANQCISLKSYTWCQPVVTQGKNTLLFTMRLHANKWRILAFRRSKKQWSGRVKFNRDANVDFFRFRFGIKMLDFSSISNK